MKVAVIACLEPEHLGDCLRALGLWTDRADVIVVNNGNTRQRADAIRSTCERFGVEVLRPHAIADGRNTIFYLHEALKSICRSHPDETILKVDEDILIAPERPIAVEPHTFWVPAVTINNYTSKLYLRALWPELFEACRDHAWIWHEPHPATRRSLRLELLRRFYDSEPALLAGVCDADPRQQRIGRDEWAAAALMGGPGDAERRGISSTALAFRAADYLELAGDAEGIEEVLIADGVYSGRYAYVVDHGAYCHHVNYWPLRPIVQANADYVAAYNRRVLDLLQARMERSLPAAAQLAAAQPAAA